MVVQPHNHKNMAVSNLGRIHGSSRYGGPNQWYESSRLHPAYLFRMITAGGTMPGNLMVAGVFGTALTIISGASPSLAPTFAVPFSLLGISINQAYMTINAFWVHKADKYLEQGNITGVRLMNYVPSGITSTILYGVPAFCLVYFGGDFATKALAAIPQNIIDALNVVGALMPALGIAMLLSFLAKKKIVAFSSLDTSQLYMPNWTQWQSQSSQHALVS